MNARRVAGFAVLALLPVSAGAVEDTCLKHKADLEKAQKCYEARVTRDPKDLEARARLGGTLNAAGEYPEALKQFDAVLAISGGYIEAMNGKAISLIAMDKPKDGIRLFEEALALDPNNLHTLTNYGRIALSLGEIQIAADMFNHAIALAPNDTEANLGLAELHLTKKNRQEAIALLATAVESDDTNARANFLLGKVLMEEDRADESLPFLARATFLAPLDADGWMTLGRARFRAGFPRTAGQAFVEAGKLDPKNPLVFLEIGKCYVDLNEYKQAQDSYKVGFDLAKNHPEVRVQLHLHQGILLQEQMRYAPAEQQYEKALALDSEQTTARLNLGVVQHLQGRLDEAVATFRTLLVDYPLMESARYNLIATLLAQRDLEGAQLEINDLAEGPVKVDAVRRLNETKRRGLDTAPPGAATETPRSTPQSKPK